MSKRKDRERAKSGQVFRNKDGFGGLVDVNEWNAVHQTKEQRQVQVDNFVKEEFAKRAIREPDVATAYDNVSYYCRKCEHNHNPGTQIHQSHRDQAVLIVSE